MSATVPRATLTAAAVALGLLLTAPSAGATVVHCGDTITHSVNVTADVVCPPGFGNGFPNGTAITVNGNGITVDFLNHTITYDFGGAPSSFDTARGMLINGSGTTVKNASMSNFSFGGIVVEGNSDTLLHMTVNGSFSNRFGYVNGIVVNGSHNVLNADRTSDWKRGVVLEGASNIVAYHSDTVCDFDFSSPGTFPEAAVRVDGDGNTVRDSTLLGCASVVINGAGGTTVTRNNFTLDDEGGHGSDISANKGFAYAFNNAVGENVHGNQSTFPRSSFPGGSGYLIAGGANNVFKSNRAQGQQIGFEVHGGSGLVLQDNTAGSTTTSSGGGAEGNGTGIWITDGAAGTKVLTDNASSNQSFPFAGTGDGILIDPSATTTTLSGNIANRNERDGIDAGNGKLISNTARYNGRYGIEAAPGTVDGGGNRASGNVLGQCVNVACGT